MEHLLHPDFIENKALLTVVVLIFSILIFATLLFWVVGIIRPKANLTELKSRTKSWWIMASLVLGAVLFNTTISYIAIALLSFLAFRELYSVLGFRMSDRRAIFLGLCIDTDPILPGVHRMVWRIYHFYSHRYVSFSAAENGA